MKMKNLLRIIAGKAGRFILYAALIWLAVGYIVVPMANTAISSLEADGHYSLYNYIEYLTNTNSVSVITNTLRLGVCTVAVCGTIGTGLALYMSFACVKFRKLLHVLLLSPMMVPGVIIVISFIQLYGESGLVTKSIELLTGIGAPYRLAGFGGILFVHAYTQYVYFYLNVSVALKYLDYSTIEAARGLGASWLRIFITVIAPAVAPALLSSAVVTFISGISSFSAPNLIGGGYKVLSTQILMSKANGYMNIASMQVVIMMLLGMSVLIAVRRLEKKYAVETSARAVPHVPVSSGSSIVSVGINIVMFVMVLMIILPILAIFLLSFVKPGTWMVDIFPREFSLGNFVKLTAKRRVMAPFINSLTMSAITVILGIAVTLPASYMIAKRPGRLNSLTELLLMLPWAMPASTIAINLINTFNTRSIFAFNHVLIGAYWILPIAYTIMAVPLMTRTSIIAMESFSTSLEEASQSLGAGTLRTFASITIPVVSPAIFSGGALIFIRTVGEYTASALLYGVSNRPVSIAMVNAMNEYDIGLSMAYGTLTILICFAAMTLIMRLDKSYKV